MREFTTKGAYKELSVRAHPYTPLSRVREILREYSRRYNVPIRVSEKAFRDEDVTDSFLYVPPSGGKFEIYVHPICTYYSEEDIRATVEHELEHLAVERKGWKRTKKGVEYRFRAPKKGKR